MRMLRDAHAPEDQRAFRARIDTGDFADRCSVDPTHRRHRLRRQALVDLPVPLAVDADLRAGVEGLQDSFVPTLVAHADFAASNPSTHFVRLAAAGVATTG